MAKVIMTIVADNGMDLGNILSFKTENYIGIWDGVNEGFALIRKTGECFAPYFLGGYRYKDLRELYDVVYEECQEYITEVFDNSNYSFVLDLDVI